MYLPKSLPFTKIGKTLISSDFSHKKFNKRKSFHQFAEEKRKLLDRLTEHVLYDRRHQEGGCDQGCCQDLPGEDYDNSVVRTVISKYHEGQSSTGHDG